ncbi:MAG: SDR family NAD(P)-dependent oxidoreductase, partial [Planctomycetes bacterium]|nr:SDR family NAD(P)-dependent oxidoreductase [Planctomycetota bacterium]
TLSEQRFSSVFTGEEFFFKDHLVKGQKVLPGVAYLEMARVALEQAADINGETGITSIQLKNIVWARPIVVNGGPQKVNISLLPEENGQNGQEGDIAYEVHTEGDDSEEEPVVHSQGVAIFGTTDQTAPLNLTDLQARINQNVLSAEQCYEAFKAIGIDYGPAHQGIEDLCSGDNEVLAKLSLPSSVVETKESFILHPSIMDAALQASIGLSGESTLKLALSFALESLEVLSRCQESMWAWVRYAEGCLPADKVQRLDIDLCDDEGDVCVRMRGFSSRVLEGELAEPSHHADSSSEQIIEPPVGLLTLSPVWSSVQDIRKNKAQIDADARVLIIGATKQQTVQIKIHYPNAIAFKTDVNYDTIVERFNAEQSVDHIIWIVPDIRFKSLETSEIIEAQNGGVLLIFKAIKALLASGYGSKDLAWTFITTQAQTVFNGDKVNPTHAGVHGLIGSLAKEYTHWNIRLVDVEADADLPLHEILALPYDAQGNALACRKNSWFKQELVQVRNFRQKPFPETKSHYKTGGVYVVIGGAGGIGEVWSRWLIERYRAQIILVGRREQDTAIETKLDSLSKSGRAPVYIQADATDRTSLEKAYRQIKQSYSQINGVIHSAIVLSDKSLANMDEERFLSSLRAKADISVCLAQVFKQEDLDFVMFFSSLQTFLKAPGQSNYAAGCTFTDAFAQRLAQDWQCDVKVMNWGYWGSVGIVTDDAYRERMACAGIGSIEPEEGMMALEELLNGALDQTVLIKTLNADVIQGLNTMSTSEWLTSYSGAIPAIIHDLQEAITDNDQAIQAVDIVIATAGQHNQEMDDILQKLLLSRLQTMGVFKENVISSDIFQNIIDNRYKRWMEESIAVLQCGNNLKQDVDDGIVIDRDELDSENIWSEWERRKQTWLQNPGLKAQVVLVDVCLRALPDILTGKQHATDIMFSNSSMALVEGIYKDNPVSDMFNDLLGDTLVAYIQQRIERDADVQLRILEIGAGTGGTTAGLLKRLMTIQDHIQEYCYTDISKAFLMHAETNYAAECPYLTTQIFNIESPIAGQAIQAGQYDVVIAANVLHATKDIRRTLRNSKAALRKGGILLLNELSNKSLFTHLTFGLLDGWWLYEDSDLRMPGSPGLNSETWEEVLKEEGFYNRLFPAQKVHALGQQIIVSQSDGIVRQKQTIRPTDKTATEQAKTKVIPTRTKNNVIRDRIVQQCSLAGAKTVQNNIDVTDQMIEDHIQETIREKASEALKVKLEEIDLDDSFSDYGVDSIIGVNLAKTLNQALGIELQTTSLFNFNTVNQLSSHIFAENKDKISQELANNRIHIENSKTLLVEGEEKITQGVASKRSFNRKAWLKKEATLEKTIEQIIVPEPIAIIGISGKFPQADTLDTFWQNLKEGKDCITEIPKERWDWQSVYGNPHTETNKTTIKWGGFIDGVDQFDPLFFGISPREAELMDPQQRLLMAYVWKAIEDAAIDPKVLSKQSTGVFIAAGIGEYIDYLAVSGNKASAITGSVTSMIPNRISYVLDLHGPSEYCETACSSTLVALHRAIQSIQHDECEQAVVGAVNLLLSPRGFVGFEEMGYLSPEGETNSFQAEADGYVRSEGVGAVVIKPLSKAIEDRDHIHALIKGTGIFHGGKGMSLTAPNAGGMRGAIKHAYHSADVDPHTVSYIEAHGIASPMGDGIEINALKAGYKEVAESCTKSSFTDNPCYIGTLKPCIGHGEIVSGMAALMKVVLAIRNKTIPGVPRLTTLNEHVTLDDSPFRITAENQDWQSLMDGDGNILPRRAGINSYGFGGVNAHVVMEEYIPESQESYQREDVSERTTTLPQLVVFSAKTPERLLVVVQQMLEFAELHKSVSLLDIAYTLQVGREAMEERLAIFVETKEDFIQKLNCYLQGSTDEYDSQNIFVSNGDIHSGTRLKRIVTGDVRGRLIKDSVGRKDFIQLALLWVEGINVSWEELYEGQEVKRISLPTYPFEKRRCWIDNQQPTAHDLPMELRDKKQKKVSFTDVGNNGEHEIEEQLESIICEVIGIQSQELKRERALHKDYGVDSVAFLKLQYEISERLSLTLNAEEFFRHNTISEFINSTILKSKSVEVQSRSEKQEKLVSGSIVQNGNALSSTQRLMLNYNRQYKRVHTRTLFFQTGSDVSSGFLKTLVSGILKQHVLFRCCFQRETYTYTENEFLDVASIVSKHDWSKWSEKRKKEGLALINKPEIDLATGPPIRAALVTLDSSTSLIGLSLHHIAFDAYSLNQLLSVLSGTLEPTSLNGDYDDFVYLENQSLNSEHGKSAEQFWQKRLHGSQVQVRYKDTCYKLQKPASSKGEKQADGTYKSVLREYGDLIVREKVFSFSKDMSTAMPIFCKKYQLSENSLLQYLYLMSISTLSYQKDYTMGTMISYPRVGKMEKIMGPLLNVSFSRLVMREEMKIIDHLREFHDSLVKQIDYAKYPVEKIFELKQSEWQINPRTNDFNVPIMFNYLNTRLILKEEQSSFFQRVMSGHKPETKIGGVELQGYEPEGCFELCNADLFLFITVTEKNIIGRLRVKDNKFKKSFDNELIKNMKKLFRLLLKESDIFLAEMWKNEF